MTEAQKDEHRWLERLVGDWTFEVVATMGDGQDPTTSRGVERTRSIELWVVSEGEGEMCPGHVMKSIMTLGFDPKRERFIGTFVASPMTHLWVYEGTLNAERTLLTLDTEGPSFLKEGEMGRYRDLIELLPDGRRRLRSQALKDDGTWWEFLVATYTRTG